MVGCGGVGINAVQFARAAGASVIAVDLKDEKLAVARRLGAIATFNPGREPEFAREVRRITEGGADVAIEAVGRPQTVVLVRRGACSSRIRKGSRTPFGWPRAESTTWRP